MDEAFAACRPRLLGIAYGLLGELTEAEDVVQDAWLRWHQADRDEVRNAEAFLVTVTTRLALDRLRSARARNHAGDATRRRKVSEEERQRLTVAFLGAAISGDMDGVRELLAADAIMYTDGGGVVTAARKPIYGAAKIARFMVRVQRKSSFPDDPVYTPVLVNGDPGVLMESVADGFLSIAAVEIADGAVQAVRFFNNPERFPVEFPRSSA